MTVQLLSIPEEPTRWAEWLERQLLGLQLRDLVEELRLNPGLSPAKELSLPEVLSSEEIAVVVSDGIAALNVGQIRLLLGNPGTLLKLQEQVLVADEPYWNQQLHAGELDRSIDRIREQVFANNGIKANLVTPAVPKPVSSVSSSRLTSVLAFSAAVLVLGFLFWPSTQPSALNLGSPELLVNDVSSSQEYFERIAEAGNRWFDTTTREKDEFRERLQQVSANCQTLIDARHNALTEVERTWFVAKCENWKNKFDDVLASLDNGELTLADAQAEADKIMLKLVQVLEEGLESV